MEEALGVEMIKKLLDGSTMRVRQYRFGCCGYLWIEEPRNEEERKKCEIDVSQHKVPPSPEAPSIKIQDLITGSSNTL